MSSAGVFGARLLFGFGVGPGRGRKLQHGCRLAFFEMGQQDLLAVRHFQDVVMHARLVHVDLTIICERPRVGPHRAAMRARLAELTGLPLARISIKGKTTEGLGFTGRGEGLAVQALATVTFS